MNAAGFQWEVPQARAARLALAKAYPFAIPAGSYLLSGGAAMPLPHFATLDLAGRVPVLAVGSNQSPEHLARKFAHLDGACEVPVTRAWLDDFDVVYATHVTRYGSVPGNLHPAPGARVRLSVTWLDAHQLPAMHVTEIAGENYVFARLDGIALQLDDGPRLDSVCAYVSLHGSLNEAGSPVGLAAMQAEGRAHPALDQPGVLALLHGRAGADLPLDDLIIDAIERPERRAALTALLRRDPLPFAWPRMEVLLRTLSPAAAAR
jgi:hypothetical protein